MNMRAIRMHAPYDVRLDNIEIPEMKEDEVRCKAICSLISTGTEAIQYSRTHDKSMHRQADLTQVNFTGYSMCAEVIDVGREVKGYKKGDIVFAIENHKQYFNIKPYLITKMPDYMTPEEMCWLTILRCALFANMQINTKPWETIVVGGLGAFGFASVQFAKIFNARKIIAVEPDPYRAEMAKEYGATDVITGKLEDVVEDIIAINGGKLVDGCIDATSTAGNIKWLQYILKRNGNLCVICDPANTDQQLLNYGYLHYRGQHIHGVYIDMQIPERDPMKPDQRDFVNPWYPMDTEYIHQFILDCFKTGQLKVKDLICGKESPENCSDIFKRLWKDRSRMLGIEYDWTLLE